ncbi:ABC-2 transporter permease [Mammaliicoccus fleurettii]|nr:ABC-2 transporter permease [Mammaliicoccus fleurettii]
MKAILYRNLVFVKPYLFILLGITLMSPLLIVIPIQNFFKIAILGVLVITIHIVFLVWSYYLYLRISKNHSELTFLSLPVKQTTVIIAHYFTAIILILLTQVTLAILSATALLFKGSGMEVTIDFTSVFMNISANLLTVSLILPLAEYKRLLKIPLIFWIIIVGAIIPNMIQYIDNLIGVFYIHTEVFSQYDMEIYLGCSIILFVITYILAINKARKNTITI